MSPLIIVVLVVMAIIGSVMMLKPSAKQARLAEQRLEAIKLGLQVKLETFEPESEKNGVRNDIRGALYLRYFPDVKSQKIKWRVVRQPAWDSEGLPESWSWHDKDETPDLAALNELLEALPEDVLLVEAFDNRVALITEESQQSTALLINDWLHQAARL